MAEEDEADFCSLGPLLEQKDVNIPKPAVLVLGGSTFMGRETVQALLDFPARVCVVNRGRSYWGTNDPSGGRAARVLADRKDAELFAARLDVVTERLGERWALVADFSAYNGKDIRAALSGLRGRFETYAYISSDSVYEVSSWAGKGWTPPEDDSREPGVNECDSTRPADSRTRKRLRKADSYGDGKLLAEEALAAGLAEDSSAGRGVCLRLPDVIGPFDDTMRLWAFWHWLQVSPSNPPQAHIKPDNQAVKRRRTEAPPPALAPLAVVFSRDVARFMVNLVARQAPVGVQRCDAVNVGCLRQPTLSEFLELLATASGIEKPKLQETDNPKAFLPSVDRPWPLCLDRLLKTYGFEPTPLEDVLSICAAWFAKACAEFPKEALEAARKLPPGAREAAVAKAGLPTPPPSSSNRSSSCCSESS